MTPSNGFFTQPIHTFELLFGDFLKGRNLHSDGGFELHVEFLSAMRTSDRGHHLLSMVIIGADGEMPWIAHCHEWFATALTITGTWGGAHHPVEGYC